MKNRRRHVLGLLVTIGLAASSAQVLAQGIAANAQPLSQIELLKMPQVVDNAVSRAIAQGNESGGHGPYHFAERIDYQITPEQAGTWESLPDGSLLWRVRINSETALNLNLGFDSYWMPEGAKLFMYSPDYSEIYGPFTSADNADHGQFWTPAVEGNEVVLELQLPAGVEMPKLHLASVNHGFRKLGSLLDIMAENDRSGSCNVDVVCPEGDNWRDQIRSSGAYTVGGTDTCSGSLVNNANSDKKGYFLTAYHCSVTTSNAASVVIYWNYQNSTCRTPGSSASGGNGNGSHSTFSSGTTFRARNNTSDFCLLETTQPINPTWNLYWSGIDASSITNVPVVGIHHPGVEEKRISFENDPVSLSTYLGTSTPGDSTHIWIHDWDLGTTEGGSSGSPLYDQNTKRIIGQLHGGTAACGNNSPDYYGRVFLSWTGGGTAATQLKAWLDPNNTGVLAIDGRGESPLVKGGNPAIDDTHGNGDGNGVVERGENDVRITFPITNSGTAAVTVTSAVLESQSPGVTVTTSSADYGTLGAGNTTAAPTPFAISVGPDHACGSAINLKLTLLSAGDSAIFTYQIPTGPICDVLPSFTAGALALSDATGNNNGAAEPGETLSLSLPITNIEGPATGASVTVESLTATAFVGAATSSYGSIANGATASGATPFTLTVSPDHVCGAPISLRFTATANGVSNVFTDTFRTGLPGGLEDAVHNFDADTTLGAFTAPGSGTGWSNRTQANANTPARTAGYVPPTENTADFSLVSPDIVNPTALSFYHTFNFEESSGNSTYDGGVLEVSTDGGNVWTDLGPKITLGGYAHVYTGGNPLNGRSCWGSGAIAAMTRVNVDLSQYNQQTIKVRWRFTADGSVSSTGWYVDTITFTQQGRTCSPVTSTDTTTWSVQ